MGPRPTSPCDQFIGSRIRAERMHRGISQQELAVAIGVTYQQVHKYERGTNRVSVAHLLKICRALNMTIFDILSGITSDQPLPETPRHRLCIEHAKLFAGLSHGHQEAVHEMAATLSRL